MRTVKWKDWECFVAYAHYPNGRTAIQLIDCDDGSPVAMASVNIPDEDLAPGEVCIKDYSENEGILEALIVGNYVSKPLRFVESGYVTIPVCRLSCFHLQGGAS